jgi:hypothetical protein
MGKGNGCPCVGLAAGVNGGEKSFCQRKLERVKGFEPSAESALDAQNQVTGTGGQADHTQIRAQIPDTLGRDVSLVVAAWPRLSGPLKAAILAIINSANGTEESGV